MTVISAHRFARAGGAAGTWLVSCRVLVVAVCSASIQARAHEPTLPAKAPSVGAMVPSGWLIERQLRADLNSDGRRDVLVVLQRAPGTGIALSPQRALAVLAGVRGGYALAALNVRLVPQVDLATQEDPLADAELVARRGGFDLRLNVLAGTGSYQSASLRYRFRYRDGCFRLTTYERLQTHRATLDTQDLRADLIRGVVVHTEGNAKSVEQQVRRKRLSDRRPRCLQDLGSAADYRPL